MCKSCCSTNDCDASGATTAALADALYDLRGEPDDLADHDPQTGFWPLPQIGVVKFRDLVLAAFPGTRSLGINRGRSTGGRSEHKEGRAWDWGVCAACQSTVAGDLLDWLLAPDAAGRPFAAARRLGLMYIIWNGRIWGAYAADQGWRDYRGPNPHTDHVHFSFSKRGAAGLTSWWRTNSVPGHAEPVVTEALS